MKLKKNLVLLGMMGCGKSTIGTIISQKKKLIFLDIDKLIEKETNMKITEIFEKKSEKFFRNLEEKITLKSLSLSKNVIALGGGAFLNEKIRKEVITNNYSVWLNCDSKTLISRLKNNKKRPLALNIPDNELLELISKRSKIYSKSQFKINCHKLTKNEIVKKIIDLYNND
jgi:shikimate kinase|tara:strand:- start:1009 stop:1521 length:513 start_codon:yes stop_codon:yes gene_type:complete